MRPRRPPLCSSLWMSLTTKYGRRQRVAEPFGGLAFRPFAAVLRRGTARPPCRSGRIISQSIVRRGLRDALCTEGASAELAGFVAERLVGVLK